ncbi:hypothetical protein ES703_20190 [subsurface metagenome]
MEYIESYYLESRTGLLFTVKGPVHPPETVVAYLKYAPDPEGERIRDGVRYRKLYILEEQEALLKDRYPACLFFDPVFGEFLQGLPRKLIKKVYDPRLKLAELQKKKNRGELEENAVRFTGLLAERAGVSTGNIGISGSLLVDLPTPHSDIDLVVYGSGVCRAVHKALWYLLDGPEKEVRRLNEEGFRRLYASRYKDTPVDFEEVTHLERRKVIQAQFRESEYFIRFVKLPGEIKENYGDRRFTSPGEAEIEARVVDAGEAFYTPCTYKVEKVRFLGAVDTLSLREIVSFSGMFCEQAREGEIVKARGKLEKVVTIEGEVYHRLLLGRPGDFMLVS